jgi:type I restriction enzyme M protein
VYEQTYKEFSGIFESEKFDKQGLDTKIKYPTIALETINDFYKQLKAPFKEIEQLIGSLKSSLLLIEEKGKKAKLKKQEITKQLAPVKNKITVLSKPLSVYASRVSESLKDGKQAIIDWEALVAYFPKGIYQDVEGLCKIASLSEIEEQDYSLTPGRYVGVKIDIDMDFDYKGRMTEIHTELAQLNTEANSLIEQIQSVKL